MYNITEYNFFTDIFQEQGIVKLIIDYKIELEDREIIDDYDGNWDLITKYGIKEKQVSDHFILRNLKNINISLLLRNNPVSEYIMNIIKKDLMITDWDFYFLNNRINFDFIIENKLFIIPNFFFNYFLMRTDDIHVLSEEELFILLNQLVDNYNEITPLDLNYFIKAILKTQNLPKVMIDYALNMDHRFMTLFSMGKRNKIRRIFQIIYLRVKTHFFSLVSLNPNINLDIEVINKYQDMILWKSYSRNENISREIIINFYHKLDMEYISEYNKVIDENFIKSDISKFSLNHLAKNKHIKFSKRFMILYFEKKHIENRLSYQPVDLTLITYFKDNINWVWVCRYQKLTNNFVLLNKKYIDWNVLIEYNNHISLDIILSYSKRINFDLLIKKYNLPDYFLRKYKNSINWSLISKYQILSKKNIEKYRNRLDWGIAIKYQKNITFEDLLKYHK